MKTLGAIWLCALLLLPPSDAQTERADTDSQLERHGNNDKTRGGQTSTLTSNTVTNTMRKRSAAASPDPALDIVIDIVKDIDANIDLDLDLELAIDFTLDDEDDDDDTSVASTAAVIQRRWGGGGYDRASAARPAVSSPGYTAGGGYWDHYNSGDGSSSGAPARVDHTQEIPATVVSTGYQRGGSGANGYTKTKDNSPPSNPPRQSVSTSAPVRENYDSDITVTITSTQAQTQTKTMTISSVSGSRHPSKRWTVPK